MYIDRRAVALILKVKIGNIRKVNKIEENICVQLWDSKEKVTISVQEYKQFIAELKANPKLAVSISPQEGAATPNNTSTQRTIGIILIIIGAIIGINGCTMDTTVSTSFGSVNNIGLLSEKNNRIQTGGMIFLGGVLLYALDKRQ
ncbi:hypothetical protein CAL7716_101690 (plasmid) [Calothrix sp. PCC 7716]|nr:hypothetical protein CAL7716_101690 [Calothrix sp. PCC 7716]